MQPVYSKMPYQSHYGIQLLDDIHNYFPAILYEPERFRHVGELLQYIRFQTQNRFDLFSAGQAMHNTASRQARATNTSVVNTSLNARSMIRPRVESLVAPLTQTILIDESQDNIQGFATQLLREILTTPAYAAQAPMNTFLNPVVVRPTAEQIATSTTIETVVGEGEMCTICQDRITSGTEARSINACEHTFHTGCIDTWFTTNVRCPVCRHDIREEE